MGPTCVFCHGSLTHPGAHCPCRAAVAPQPAAPEPPPPRFDAAAAERLAPSEAAYFSTPPIAYLAGLVALAATARDPVTAEGLRWLARCQRRPNATFKTAGVSSAWWFGCASDDHCARQIAAYRAGDRSWNYLPAEWAPGSFSATPSVTLPSLAAALDAFLAVWEGLTPERRAELWVFAERVWPTPVVAVERAHAPVVVSPTLPTKLAEGVARLLAAGVPFTLNPRDGLALMPALSWAKADDAAAQAALHPPLVGYVVFLHDADRTGDTLAGRNSVTFVDAETPAAALAAALAERVAAHAPHLVGLSPEELTADYYWATVARVDTKAVVLTAG